MNIADAAQDHEAQEWEIINASRRGAQSIFKPSDAGYGPAECDDCGEEMPDVRRAYGFSLCVHCKGSREARQGRR